MANGSVEFTVKCSEAFGGGTRTFTLKGKTVASCINMSRKDPVATMVEKDSLYQPGASAHLSEGLKAYEYVDTNYNQSLYAFVLQDVTSDVPPPADSANLAFPQHRHSHVKRFTSPTKILRYFPGKRGTIRYAAVVVPTTTSIIIKAALGVREDEALSGKGQSLIGNQFWNTNFGEIRYKSLLFPNPPDDPLDPSVAHVDTCRELVKKDMYSAYHDRNPDGNNRANYDNDVEALFGLIINNCRAPTWDFRMQFLRRRRQALWPVSAAGEAADGACAILGDAMLQPNFFTGTGVASGWRMVDAYVDGIVNGSTIATVNNEIEESLFTGVIGPCINQYQMWAECYGLDFGDTFKKARVLQLIRNSLLEKVSSDRVSKGPAPQSLGYFLMATEHNYADILKAAIQVTPSRFPADLANPSQVDDGFVNFILSNPDVYNDSGYWAEVLRQFLAGKSTVTSV